MQLQMGRTNMRTFSAVSVVLHLMTYLPSLQQQCMVAVTLLSISGLKITSLDLLCEILIFINLTPDLLLIDQ